MKISVALCTYNGAGYLKEQLASLRAQSRLPDELVVCDDGSSDTTIKILDEFKADAPFPVRLHVNAARLGPAKNFERAISLCEGDLIALCDQDDVWLPEKIEIAAAHLEKSPHAAVFFSDGIVVDADLHPLGYALWQQVGFTEREGKKMAAERGMEVLLKHFVVTGATLVMRATLRRQVLPLPSGWMHDAWIALVAAASNRLLCAPNRLFLYRQHGTNQIGAPRRSWIKLTQEAACIDRASYYEGEIARYRAARARLLEFSEDMRGDALSLIDAKLRHLQRRASLPAVRPLRIPIILHELATLGYYRYSVCWQVAVKDVLMSGKPSA